MRRCVADDLAAGRRIWARLGPIARHLLAPADPRLPAAHEGGAALAGPLPLRRLPRAATRRSTRPSGPPSRRLCERQELVAPMSMLGDGAVAIWHDIAPEGRDAFYAWHGQEHMPERVGDPGLPARPALHRDRGRPRVLQSLRDARRRRGRQRRLQGAAREPDTLDPGHGPALPGGGTLALPRGGEPGPGRWRRDRDLALEPARRKERMVPRTRHGRSSPPSWPSRGSLPAISSSPTWKRAAS